MEHELGIAATYYFRSVPESWDEGIIREIASLGHEIGYHYENLSEISKKNPQITQITQIKCFAQRRKGAKVKKQSLTKARRSQRGMNRMVGWKQLNVERGKNKEGLRDKLFELAYEDFCRNLEKLRAIVPVKTICMHGSPLSRVSNLDLWKRYDYKELDILGEPYLDVDFDEVLYLTDTGRRWDGDAFNIRDKVETLERGKGIGLLRRMNRMIPAGLDGKRKAPQLNTLEGNPSEIEKKKALHGVNPVQRGRGFRDLGFHSTFDIIDVAEKGLLPEQMMMTFHPQR